MKRFITVLAGCLLATTALAQEASSNWPEEPIHLVVPFPAGNNTDIVARILGQAMSGGLGQPIIIDNRPGASGAIGMNAVATASPDGYTIGIGSTSTQTISAVLTPDLPFDPATAFEPIGLIGSGPYVIAVSPTLEAETLSDLIALAQERPGELAYGTTGEATFSNLMTLNLASVAGIELNHVPYNAAGEAAIDVAAGRIDMQFSTVASTIEMIRSGQLKPIAVATPERLAELPDVPTITESGIENFETGVWWSLIAPAGTPAPIIERLNSELNAALADEAVIEALGSAGVVPESGTPESLAELVRTDLVRWNEVAQEAGLVAQ